MGSHLTATSLCCEKSWALVRHCLAWCTCWAGIDQAECSPRWWCPHANFASALRSAGFEFGFDPVTSKAAYICPYSPGAWRLTYDATYMYMFQVISSPMLLYRLRCLFPSYEVKQGDGDLRVWNVNLRHRRTHCQADFEDLKGGAIVTAEPALEKDEAATQNLLDLIEVLCSDCCPHTYDGLVAGCVA